MALHWVLGLALAAMFGVGLYMADLPFSPLRLKLYNWHKWAGVVILSLSLARLLWRLTHRPPDLSRQIETACPPGSCGRTMPPTACCMRCFLPCR